MSSVEHQYPVIGCKGTRGIFDRLPVEALDQEKDHSYPFALFILAFAAIQQCLDALQVMEEPAGTFMEIAEDLY
jgi:tyrosinase